MRSLRAGLAVLVVSSLALTACQRAEVVREGSTTTGGGPGTTLPPSAERVSAPDFPPDLDWLNTDRPLSLAQLRGKIVILDFWTYGCINCIHIIPDLKRLEEEYADELVVIGVHSAKFENESDTDNIRQIVLRYGLDHPVVNDRDFAIWNRWGARAWPTLAIVDPAGKVVGAHSGEGIYEIFEPVLDALVAEFDTELDRSPLELKLERAGLPQTALSFPGKVLVDEASGRLFVSDTNHHRIIVAGLDGEVIEVIGSGERGNTDGPFRTATFAQPQGLALQDEVLYVADTENHLIRAVDLPAGRVSTLAGTGEQGRFPPQGGPGLQTGLNSPWDVVADGDRLYVAMAGYHQIWMIDLGEGTAAPYAGNAREGTTNGPLDRAELAQPSGVAIDPAGRLFFADSESSSIRWVDVAGGDRRVQLLAGGDQSLFQFGDEDGTGTEARFQHPLGVVVDGGFVWVADTYNSKIRRIDPAGGEVTTLAGGQGWRDGPRPLFHEPGGIDAGGGKLYVADTNNHSIRVVDQATGEASTLVLKGLERYSVVTAETVPAVVLDPVEVAAGPGDVVLDVTFPAGYKVNPLAPSRFEWGVDGAVARLDPGASGSVVAPEFPFAFAADFTLGSGSLTGDLYLVYCEAEQESICLIDQVRMVVPLTVTEGGTSTVRIEHTVKLPDL